MVSFCLAPALVMYQWALANIGKLGWMIAFIYTACGALRLACFNTQIGIADKRYFQGLASPAASGCIAGWIWVNASNNIDFFLMTAVAPLLTFVCGILMVSTMRYHSFKGLDLHGRVPFVVMLVLVLIFALIALDPALMLFAGFALYALSGPILTLTRIRQHRLARQQDK